MTSAAVAPAVVPTRLTRGSEWRKWDLHVHTPLSALNNQFPSKSGGGPDWEAYLDALEDLKDIAVVGVTDYFSVEGYKRLREYKLAGRLKNIDLLLPNVELRLDNILASKKDGKEPRRLNLHVIFSDLISPDDIEEFFLRELKFNCNGVPDEAVEEWSVSRKQLERLGKRLKQEQATLAGSDYEVGCTQATVSLKNVMAVLSNRRSLFEDKFLVVMAEQFTTLVDWNSQDHQTRKVVLQSAHAIFSSNPQTHDWALGLKGLSREQFIDEFKSLKPCIHGSDAHDLEHIAKPSDGRYCWIKADTTFEGLRQILFEPQDRVFIGDAPPLLKHDYQVVEAISVSGADDWFESTPIPLNRDLVAIVGGRGSGKSALAELIAYAGGSNVFREPRPKDIEDSFLSKASTKSSTNPNPVTGAKIAIKWADESPSIVPITSQLKHGLKDERVKYLPQKFVERLCAPENTQDIESEIERVIFQRLEKTQRLGTSNFQELRSLKTQAIQVQKTQLQTTLDALNRNIFDSFNKVAQRGVKQQELSKSKADLAALGKKAPVLPEANESELAELKTLGESKREFESLLTSLNDQLSKIAAIEARFRTFADQIAAFNNDMTVLLSAVQLKAEAPKFLVSVPPQAMEVLAARRKQIEDDIKLLKAGTPEQAVCLDAIIGRIAQLQENLNLSESKRAQYQKFEADKQSLEERIAAIEGELQTIASVLEPKLLSDRRSRLEKYLDFFELLKQERATLDELYDPLKRALMSGGDTDKKLTFTSRINFDHAGQARRWFEIVDSRRKSAYRDESLLELKLRQTFSAIEAAEYDREATKGAITELRESFLRESDGTPITISEQLRKDKTEEDFNRWFFSLDRFSVTYSIKFDGKPLQLLSPGQKGIVLLLVYLEVDQDDNRPLVVDQPEDNLDNLSVYSNLIEYFRKRKKKRQIIIITHNPNLVVNTDAEQIIIADFDGTRKPHIQYRSGALEDSVKGGSKIGIRERVCEVLEGGSEAFIKREQKYSLPAQV